ncbi:TrkA C-terminal domain-containing protein [Streptomyces sp. NPDC049949]
MTVIRIKGSDQDFIHATAETVVEKGDVIVVTGKIRDVEAFAELS